MLLCFIALIVSPIISGVETTFSPKNLRLHEQEAEEKCRTVVLKRPSPIDGAKWAALLKQSLHPLWLTEPVYRIITDYIGKSHTWKYLSKTSIPPSTACAYIPQSASGPLLAVGNAETRNIQLLKSDDGSIVKDLVGHTNDIKQLIYSQRNAMLISNSKDGSIRLWRIREKAEESEHFETLSFTGTVALSPDEQSIATFRGGYGNSSYVGIAPLLDLRKGKESHYPHYCVVTVAWDHDSKVLLVHGHSWAITWKDGRACNTHIRMLDVQNLTALLHESRS